MKTDALRVPGANLYYEVRGSGPVLLLICGGVYDAAGYAGLAGQLADRYTVVTYDRRGNSRSPLDSSPEAQRIEVHADDAHRLLAAVGAEAAYVFGNSSGAMIGLELAARHPEQVRALVAHEPPVFDVLPDRDRLFALMRDVEDTFAKEGPGPAGEVFGAGLMMRGGSQESSDVAGRGITEDERVPGGADAPRGEPDPEMLEMLARFEKNKDFFIGYEVPPFGRYTPDLPALEASSARVVMGAGEASVGEPPHEAAVVLAERLGGRAVLFPGDHGGFGAYPEAFAVLLHKEFSGS